MVNDLFNMVIGRFNVEGKGSIGRDEFKSLSKEMLMAIALGIGGLVPHIFSFRRRSMFNPPSFLVIT
uniref:EF-hand domain-containing protein n=1 Tax=Cannabis sativa TaxID=3483 RepID=A0A803PYV0_CANSA